MKFIHRWLLIIAPFALASCAAVRAAPEVPRQPPQAQADPEYLVDSETLRKYIDEKDLVTKKLIRNEIIDERLLEIDNQFQKYEIALWQQGVGAGIGTDWVQLAIAGATATAGGASTKSILGAVSAFITGAKASFDKNAFFEKTLAAVVAQMVGEREKMRAIITLNKQLPVSDYTLFAALADVKKFIVAGTIPGAIQGIAVDAGEKATKAGLDIATFRKSGFSEDQAAIRLQKWLFDADRNPRENNVKNLRAWMDKNGFKELAIQKLLDNADLKEWRDKAIRDLGVP